VISFDALSAFDGQMYRHVAYSQVML